MAACAVVAEGRRDAELIRRVLQPEAEQHGLRFLGAHGKNDAAALARSLLAVEQRLVLFVVDADATDEDAIDREQAELQAALNWDGYGARARVVLAVPELEAVLLRTRRAQQVLFAGALSDTEREFAAWAPKRFLHWKGVDLAALHQLADDPECIREIREESDFGRRLLAAVQDLLAVTAAG